MEGQKRMEGSQDVIQRGHDVTLLLCNQSEASVRKLDRSLGEIPDGQVDSGLVGG